MKVSTYSPDVQVTACPWQERGGREARPRYAGLGKGGLQRDCALEWERWIHLGQTCMHAWGGGMGQGCAGRGWDRGKGMTF